MRNQYAFYLEKNNKLYGGDILSVCYKATQEEIKKYNLTSENIVLFLKSKNIEKIQENKDFYYFENFNTLIDEHLILRIQCECFLGMYGDSHCDCEYQRKNAIDIISKENGMLIHLPQEAQGWGLFYKMKELDLQVSGRMTSGEFIGKKNRDDAQKILMGTSDFKDNRSYEIIHKIFSDLKINNKKIILITNSNKKIDSMKQMGFSVEKYEDYKEKDVNLENLSEYLVKILNSTHEFEDEIINKIIDLISSRKYNERSLSVFLHLIDRIKNDLDYELKTEYKDKFLELYNSIICGEEKRYIVYDENHVKVQNNFSCRVDSSIFKVLTMIYGKSIFDRISLEKTYYFINKENGLSIRVRTGRILDNIEEKCKMFKNQVHVEESIYDKKNNKVVQKEISTSKLRSYFENPACDYLKRIETVTIISENILPGVNIYIKRLPKTDNRIISIYGKSEYIKELLEKIIEINKSTLLSSINDNNLSEQNFSDYNLRFADINSIIEEELNMYDLTKKEENINGVRNKILLLD